MKTKVLVLAAVLSLGLGQAAGQNIQTEALRVWMDNITISADGTTATRLTVYENDAERDYTAFNMSLIVPEGITVAQVKKGRNWVNSIELTERAAESHSISCNMPDATTIKIICSSNQNDDLYPDDEGGNPMDELFTIDLIADPQMMNGTYTVTADGVVFGYNENNTVTGYVPVTTPSFQLTITGGQDGLIIPYTVTAAGVGTLCLPFDAAVPVGLTVYTATDVVANEVSLEKQTSIEAGKPLIVVGVAGSYKFTGLPTIAEGQYDEGLLTGTTVAKQITDGYVLQTQNGLTGFYKVEADKPINVPAYRCWLNYSADAYVLPLNIDILTVINALRSESGKAARTYDLSGRRVQQGSTLQRGIYIQQGHKQVIR